MERTDSPAGVIGREEPEERIISLVEAAKILNTSYTTAFRLAQSGELKAFRIRNSWRTSTAVCKEFIDKRFKEQSIICQSVEVR